jgi:hypothetical protein
MFSLLICLFLNEKNRIEVSTLKEKQEVYRTIFGSAALTEPFKSSA